MQNKFGIGYNGPPRKISMDEFVFREKAFNEEIQEYKDAYFADDLEGQFDALIDLIVFAVGAGLQHGFDMEEGVKRVMKANNFKDIVKTADDSKRGYKHDLVKPEGWREPYLQDLIKPSKYKGLIILDGPDACGKTTLAEHLRDNYGAVVFHSTWSPELENRMEKYMLQTMEMAISISQNQLVVLDRLWLSEMVYSHVFRPPSTRVALHTSLSALAFSSGARVIVCLPYDIQTTLNGFESMQKTRGEMYSTMLEVYRVYEGLYNGTFSTGGSNVYIEEIMPIGGLKEASNVVRYDYSSDGQDMEHFIKANNLVKTNDK